MRMVPKFSLSKWWRWENKWPESSWDWFRNGYLGKGSCCLYKKSAPGSVEWVEPLLSLRGFFSSPQMTQNKFGKLTWNVWKAPTVCTNRWGRIEIPANWHCVGFDKHPSLLNWVMSVIPVLGLMAASVESSPVPPLSDEEIAQIITSHRISHHAESLYSCSFHKTSRTNCFYIHRVNLFFSEAEVCFKRPDLSRLRVALNDSLSLPGSYCPRGEFRCLFRVLQKQGHLGSFRETLAHRFSFKKGVLLPVRRKLCGMWGGARQRRRMIHMKRRKKTGRKAGFALWELCWLQGWTGKRGRMGLKEIKGDWMSGSREGLVAGGSPNADEGKRWDHVSLYPKWVAATRPLWLLVSKWIENKICVACFSLFFLSFLFLYHGILTLYARQRLNYWSTSPELTFLL